MRRWGGMASKGHSKGPVRLGSLPEALLYKVLVFADIHWVLANVPGPSAFTRVFSYNLYTNCLEWALLWSPGNYDHPRLREVKKLTKGTQLINGYVRIMLKQPVCSPPMITPSPPQCRGKARERNTIENTAGLVFPSSLPISEVGIVRLRPQIIQENPVQLTSKPVFFPFY